MFEDARQHFHGPRADRRGGRSRGVATAQRWRHGTNVTQRPRPSSRLSSVRDSCAWCTRNGTRACPARNSWRGASQRCTVGLRQSAVTVGGVREGLVWVGQPERLIGLPLVWCLLVLRTHIERLLGGLPLVGRLSSCFSSCAFHRNGSTSSRAETSSNLRNPLALHLRSRFASAPAPLLRPQSMRAPAALDAALAYGAVRVARQANTWYGLGLRANPALAGLAPEH